MKKRKMRDNNMEVLITDRYAKAYVELLEIIKYMGKEYEEKIPKKLVLMFEKYKDRDYQYMIDDSKKLKEQKLLDETLGLLTVIELRYWATPEQKEMLDKALKNNETRYQIQLNEKYNTDNLFKEKKYMKNSEVNNRDELYMIKYNESLFKRIINKIRSLFDIIKCRK